MVRVRVIVCQLYSSELSEVVHGAREGSGPPPQEIFFI